ncbi:hypothetical protein EDB19DRAFT_2025691 [Suillus lakei]|nr:hypothetical protein EDB19DRAFT_2025691 [Suillus lakei]
MDSRAVVDSQASEKYLRIASISIALYDYAITLPAEWRFYRSQSSIFHLSMACVLFILIRYNLASPRHAKISRSHQCSYVSIIVMLVSNYGVFATNFTQETCQHYYVVAPIFKVLQTMVSQVILGVRTFNIARRNRRVGIALALFFFISITLEWFTNMFARILFELTAVAVDGNCTPGNAGKTLSAWLYYVIVMMYDLAMLTISTAHLLQYNTLSSRLERVVRVLMYDGIGYFVRADRQVTIYNFRTPWKLTAIRQGKFRIVRYQEADCSECTIRASIGYAVTWIMSQRILIHLREMQEAPRVESVVLARPVQSARNVMSGFRSKSDADFVTSPRNAHANNDVELDIRVCVERSVVVDYTDDSEFSNSWDKVAR